ncbi:DnaJ domain-containing protein [Aquincola tertiaricarbonis]|uniref:DnaJ domain-containing protein n=1 Tax=Aquincola tertiaricarbonis TaxID=391953 RepID=A0ABY4SCH9_AQUTE|nr:DnaJ domain-containing protein [Aquincola tertiaricarbonis]URI11032.1 DnaJ domain-containing protein [Aquincola tertiaricarbonis]
MTTDTLDFPEIVSPPDTPAAPAPTANVPAVVTLREAALAKITKTEQDLRALATRYDKVAFDFTTPKGRKAATEARSELRDARLTVQRAHDETKDELNDLKRDIKDKADELIAIVRPVENQVDGQIKAHEARVAEEKRIAAEKEQARKKVHEDNIATLRSYVARGAGQPSTALRKGIDVLAALVIDPAAWEEYAEAAVLARDETLASLQQMFDTTFAAEQAAIEAERVRKENEAAGAAPSEIRDAYRRLASQHHPDKGGSEARMAEINDAYRKALT